MTVKELVLKGKKVIIDVIPEWVLFDDTYQPYIVITNNKFVGIDFVLMKKDLEISQETINEIRGI